MEPSQAVDLGREAVLLVLIVGAPVLLAALIVGTVAGILQAATQVQDPTLSLVPKIVAVLLAAAVAGPWMLGRLVAFGARMFSMLP